MPVYYADASALAKRYVLETGSAWLRGLLDPATGSETFIVRITAVELIAAITRRERGGSLTPMDVTTARAAFRADLTAEYQVVEVTEAIAHRATTASTTAARAGHAGQARALSVSGAAAGRSCSALLTDSLQSGGACAEIPAL
jgi:predicted nucleic acid-binding protein